jgi:nitric oxide reductase NorQ protein
MNLAFQNSDQLRAVLAHLNIPAQANKADLINQVLLALEQGLITKQEIKKIFETAVPSPRGVDGEVRQQILDSNTKVHAALQDVVNAQSSINRVRDAVEAKLADIDGAFKRLDDRLTSKVAGLAAPDGSRISTEIQASVARLFDEFRREVPIERLEEIASTVPVFSVSKAGDVFPETSYSKDGETIDFGNMPVALWNDPQAPALVDDYIFDPAHLHQALVALDDPLPDNVWLAGERGTGKTEFVAQLAARLQRRLFRVNFDEALERADFIGGNTIVDSSVVWKPGVITQAISHPGAIVLLDEIGFARAQSLAALHALCERSPHRSITIAETGERIKVASHVVFFGADNSNGHGDSSGNFAGVREQNTAFLDRFSFTLRFDYLPPIRESGLVSTRTGLSLKASEILVGFVNVAREKARAGLLTQPPSLRQLFAWARAVKRGIPVRTAFTNAIVNKFPADCESELTTLFLSHVDEASFKQSL